MSTKGLKFSDETKRKMSDAHKGEKHPMFGKHHSEESKQKILDKKRGILPPQLEGYWKGRKQTPEHREKSIKTLTHRYQKGETSPMKGKKGLSGAKSHLWKGGITPFSQKIRIMRIKANGGSHTLGEWETLKAQYNWTCKDCSRSEPEIKLTKDHIIPVSKGGSDNIENIQPLCGSCNSKKHNTLIEKIQLTSLIF